MQCSSRQILAVISLCSGLLSTSSLAGEEKIFSSKAEMAHAIEDLERDLNLPGEPTREIWTTAAARFVSSFANADVIASSVKIPDSTSPIDASPDRNSWTTAPIDLLLPRIAMQTGSNFHVELKQASSGKDREILVLQEGIFTLSGLVEAIAGSEQEGAVRFQDGIYSINRPLFIMTTAGLEISAGQVAELSTRDGVFIMNTGKLSVLEGTLKGSDTPNKVNEFRPFILSALGGKLRLHNSKLENLGFGNRPSMRGLSAVSNPFFPVQTELDMQGNDLLDIYAVELIGMNKVVVKNNVIRDSVSSAVRIQNVSGGVLSGNVIRNSGAHGFHIFQSSKALELSNNIVQGGKGSGIHLNGGVVGTSLRDNLLVRNRKSGITLIGSACIDISGNAFLSNGHRGIFSQDNLNARFESNLFAQNDGPGIHLQGGVFEKNRTIVSGNRFVANRSGVEASQFRKLELAENNFAKQLPKLFAGELKTFLSSYLTRIGQLSKGARSPYVVENSLYVQTTPNLNRASRFSLASLDYCKL